MSEKITPEEVRHVADLARLDLSPDEELQMTRQLNAILGYMERLNQVDTTQVEPTTHALERANVFREDVVGPSLERDRALANAPETDGAHFVVPKVI
ncbi:aspartyl/glutamyl-tRNA(Asn/Gln) amidotransferase subunit C [Desulfacinum hydrothermale DSM 13146]|uniref:Aspartyl/glutamyl-tRNA(Asn/Gln) amidotransferase subunit C n=1 Tax=Desulfacinum hydrothermale DSM 13146 TaxID=1121390 RepID=A0A1W1WXD7_9BACT|nr:Asp-tRNA(Asn)/Glu-tRNA(Gln) amidotransferase subunit GatC [Desulfacinum hydrothermale]SMC16389.1 aspartyl/glutamyl-tRNA(Asn/Gln) amidotransferase subunit C [Desulfacinum hydrothermale DSM 13146]